MTKKSIKQAFFYTETINVKSVRKIMINWKKFNSSMYQKKFSPPYSANRQSAGRFPRHKAINDIVKRALDADGMHAILEPAGLDRGDGKRPDGITTFPFANGKCLAWDATCSDTFSPSALSS